MLKCFKAYDIRGRVPDELNKDIVYRVGSAFAQVLPPKEVVVGRDMRLDISLLAAAVARGLSDGGSGVSDVGLCGTEKVHFQTAYRGVGCGLMVTSSHNPMDYKGMKLVREDAPPVSGDTEFRSIEALMEFWALWPNTTPLLPTPSLAC